MDKIKILFLAADPCDSVRLRLGQELRDIRDSLQRSKHRDIFWLESRESVRPRDITQAIFDVEPQIIHFSGHGMETGELCFENIEGKMQPVQAEALVSLFELVSEQVDCIVLNACYSEIQARAIAKHIPFVIGMSQAISDKAAVTFAVGFYNALGAGRSFEDAYKFARVEIQLEGISENLTPVLYHEFKREKPPLIKKLNRRDDKERPDSNNMKHQFDIGNKNYKPPTGVIPTYFNASGSTNLNINGCHFTGGAQVNLQNTDNAAMSDVDIDGGENTHLRPEDFDSPEAEAE